MRLYEDARARHLVYVREVNEIIRSFLFIDGFNRTRGWSSFFWRCNPSRPIPDRRVSRRVFARPPWTKQQLAQSMNNQFYSPLVVRLNNDLGITLASEH